MAEHSLNIPFMGSSRATPTQNLRKFILEAKKNTVFADLVWDNHIWTISDSVQLGRQRKSESRAHFKKSYDTSNSKKMTAPLSPKFMDFAKAAFSEYFRITRNVDYTACLYALQILEQALEDFGLEPCITNLSMNVLDKASEILDARYDDPNKIAGVLERLLNIVIVPAKILKFKMNWESPFPWKEPLRFDRVNSSDSRHTENLPKVQTILALADIAHSSTLVQDVVTTSVVAIAMYAPNRPDEIYSLGCDCTTEMDSDEGPVFGLGWNPAKNGPPTTKFSTGENNTEMVLTAINNLTELGKNARIACKWYEENPSDLFLPESFEHLRGKDLTLWEVSQILGRKTVQIACHAQRWGLVNTGNRTTDATRYPQSPKAHWVSLFSFSSLEKKVISLLPRNFPIYVKTTQLKYSDALFTLPKNILAPDADTLEYVPEIISDSQIYHQLGANPGGITVFSRNNKTDEYGNPLRIYMYQFRHFLNTLAQSKSLSQSLIAMWSGRKHESQNSHYNHLHQTFFIDAYRLLAEGEVNIDPDSALDEKIEGTSKLLSISYESAKKIELGACHITRYGICRHDFSLTPCPKDKNCIGCGENIFVKGDKKMIAEAEAQIDLLNRAIDQCVADSELGIIGTDSWLDRHSEKLGRWQAALARMTDPGISDGTIITLNAVDNFQTKVGLAHNAAQLKKAM